MTASLIITIAAINAILAIKIAEAITKTTAQFFCFYLFSIIIGASTMVELL